jgi:glycosyltransferase involved in cell wall biosynthesis
MHALRTLPATCRFLDAMDDFPLFYHGLSRYSMARVEREIVRMADVVFCSATTLRDKCERLGGPNTTVRLIPNGYEMSRLPPVSECLQPGNVIGFVGTMGEWFDWSLVIELATALPSQPVHLIGPVCSLVPQLPPNVHLFPECTVKQAIDFCRGFAVGLIPFKVNPLTDSVDPIKFYELGALGVPVWSTAFGEMKDRVEGHQASRIARGVNWSSLWNRVVKERRVADDIAAFRSEHDWQSRFSVAREILLAAGATGAVGGFNP